MSTYIYEWNWSKSIYNAYITLLNKYYSCLRNGFFFCYHDRKTNKSTHRFSPSFLSSREIDYSSGTE